MKEISKLKESVLALKGRVNREEFQGLSVEAQKELVDILIKQIDHYEMMYGYLEKWRNDTFDFQHKYHCWKCIYKLPFWKRLMFLLNPFYIDDEMVKDLSNDIIPSQLKEEHED